MNAFVTGDVSLKNRLNSRRNLFHMLVWSLAVLAATLMPFDFSVNGDGSPVHYLSAKAAPDLLDIVLNVLLFVPFGLLLAERFRHRSWGWGLLSFVAGSAFAFSFSIECLQQFLPSRDPSVADVVSNTAGALIGVCAWRAWGSTAEGRIQCFRHKPSPVARAGILVGCSMIVLVIAGMLQYRGRPSDWNEEYYLMIGNEQTGDRPWKGRVFDVELSDTSTPSILMQEFAAGASPDLPTASLATLRFADGVRLENLTGNIPRFVWMGGGNDSTATGLAVTAEAWLESAEPPKEITRRIRATNEFTIRVVCTSDDPDQEGPARILSYSIDPTNGNFMIGQEGKDMVVRFRTPVTDPYGTRFPLVVANVFSRNEQRDILITFGGSALRVAVAGSNQVHLLELSPGLDIAGGYMPLDAEQFGYYRAVFYGLVFLPMLGLIASMKRTRPGYFAIGAPWLGVFALALEGTLAVTSPRPFDWTNLRMSLPIGFGVLLFFAAAKAQVR